MEELQQLQSLNEYRTNHSNANAIAEASKVIGQWMASADRRKMKAALDAAERYIFQREKRRKFQALGERKRSFIKEASSTIL